MKEILALQKQLTNLTEQLPNLVASQLQIRDNSKKLVINGLPENAIKAEVGSLLALGGISWESVLFWKRIGQPRSEEAPPRPICIDLKSVSAVPHFKSFAKTLKTSAVFSNCSVRRFETPEQRKDGYVIRQQRRNQSKPAETPQTLRPVDPPIDTGTSMETVEEARTEPMATIEPTPTSETAPTLTETISETPSTPLPNLEPSQNTDPNVRPLHRNQPQLRPYNWRPGQRSRVVPLSEIFPGRVFPPIPRYNSRTHCYDGYIS